MLLPRVRLIAQIFSVFALGWGFVGFGRYNEAYGYWYVGLLALDEVFTVRLCYTKHQRHRVAHEVVAGPGYRLMSFIRWIKVVVGLRLMHIMILTVDSPLLARENKGRICPNYLFLHVKDGRDV